MAVHPAENFHNRFGRSTDPAEGIAKFLPRRPQAVDEVFVVDDASDAPADSVPIFMPHTLRAAIQCLNYQAGFYEIDFSVSQVLVTKALPPIAEPVVINGLSGGLPVIIDGSSVPPPSGFEAVFGLILTAAHNSVSDVDIGSFPSGGIALNAGYNEIMHCRIHDNAGPGINFNNSVGNTILGNKIYNESGDGGYGLSVIVASTDNTIDSNFIGTPDGSTSAPNSLSGIYIETASNTLEHNLISGNTGEGIDLSAGGTDTSRNNVVAENLIGTSSDGTSPLPNGTGGVYSSFGVADSIVGNLISGNAQYGISVGQSVRNLAIANNYVGTSLDGMSSLTNGIQGIGIAGSYENIEGNVVSGSNGGGINLYGNYNRVNGNAIGMAPDGVTPLPNIAGGIDVIGNHNTVDSNLISGNYVFGIRIRGFGTSNNLVNWNQIGTNEAGTARAQNETGVIITQNASNNILANNLISGNTFDGVYIGKAYNQRAHDNTLIMNLIGTDSSGLHTIGNEGYGIEVDSSSGNTIGGTDESNDLNVICANSLGGILVTNPGSIGNKIMSNFVGTGLDDSLLLGNFNVGIWVHDAVGNTIGGDVSAGGNIISGNFGAGVIIDGQEATGNVLQGNYIGPTGGVSSTVGNMGWGVYINNVPANTVGDSEMARRNIISGNDSGGVVINGLFASRNVIRGNFIGTTPNGTSSLGNHGPGVWLYQTYDNRVDGGNVISGNTYGVVISDSGAFANTVDDNFIGTGNDGEGAIENSYAGILIEGSNLNYIGDSLGNVVSGNHYDGVYLLRANYNHVRRNIIGLDGTGNLALPNGWCGIVMYESNMNVIGGDSDIDGNTISGNLQSGVKVTYNSNHNTIGHNIIGSDPSRTLALGNHDEGVLITGASQGNPSIGNWISANSLWNNGLLGINLDSTDAVTPNDPLDADEGDNELQNHPVLTSAVVGTQLSVTGYVSSFPNAWFRLDFFSNDACDNSGYGEGQTYLGSGYAFTDAGGGGEFYLLLPPVPAGKFLTATATDSEGNTSEFSPCSQVVPLVSSADLKVTIGDGRDSAYVSDSLTYLLRVVNLGPARATHVVVVDTLPSQLARISETSSMGTVQYAAGVVSCVVDSLPAGDTVTVRVFARADSAHTIVERVSASASEPDPNLLNNRASDTTTVKLITDAGRSMNNLPLADNLFQNYPNPFNPTTTINFSIRNAASTSLKLYDLLGREVAVLFDGQLREGAHAIQLDISGLSTGVYVYTLRSGNFVASKKLMLIK